MLPPTPDWTETARRVRAAMAYGDLNRQEAAAAMSTSPGTLDRFTGKKGPAEAKMPSWEARWALADHVGLDRNFFSADLEALGEVTIIAGAPVAPANEVSPVEAKQRLAQRSRERAQQRRGHLEAVPDKTPTPRRRKGESS